MKHSISTGLVVLILTLSLAVTIAGCGKKAPGSAMLTDSEPPVTAEDRAIAESKKPVPMPPEPPATKGAKDVPASAMLADTETAREAVAQAAKKAGPARPEAMPAEPRRIP